MRLPVIMRNVKTKVSKLVADEKMEFYDTILKGVNRYVTTVQKRDLMLLFKSCPSSTLTSFLTAYKFDFELYGYSAAPFWELIAQKKKEETM